MSSELQELYELTVDFIPETERESFDIYLRTTHPELYNHVKFPSKHTGSDLNGSLKWALKKGKLGVVNTYLEDGKYTPKEVCVMSAQNGKHDVVDMCLDMGVKPTRQLFNAACLGGDVELAQHVEKLLSRTHHYDPKTTYQNIDYCTALYGAIAKSRVEIIKWLMLKSISPDYVKIAWILPRVKSQEIIDLVVSATPEINRHTVVSVLESLKGSNLYSLKTLVLFQDEEGALRVMEKIADQWEKASDKFQISVLRLVLQQGFVDLLGKMLVNISKDLLEDYVLDVANKATLRKLLEYIDVDDNLLVAAAIKVNDMELAEKHNWRSDYESVLVGAVLGNNLSLARQILVSERVSPRLKLKLRGYAQDLKLSAMERLLV